MLGVLIVPRFFSGGGGSGGEEELVHFKGVRRLSRSCGNAKSVVRRKLDLSR